MSRFPLIAVIFSLALAGCGGTNGNVTFTGSSNSTLTGTWAATATGNSSMGSLSSPLLTFTFRLTQATPATNGMGVAVTVSNLNFNSSSGCFDNAAVATASLTGMAGGTQMLTLQISENGNAALFSMSVPPNNSSATGSFAITGGNSMPGSIVTCVASGSGTATFTRVAT